MSDEEVTENNAELRQEERVSNKIFMTQKHITTKSDWNEENWIFVGFFFFFSLILNFIA